MAGTRISHVMVTSIPPEMKTKELRVVTTAATDDLTPASGKKIRVLGFIISQFVTGALTSTVRSTLAFGTDHTTDSTKVLAGYRQADANDNAGITSLNVNVCGAVDEVIRLTNVTFSNGGIVSRAVVYYMEE